MFKYKITNTLLSSYKESRIIYSFKVNTNNKIKTLYNVGYDYTYFQTYNKRIMYILNK